MNKFLKIIGSVSMACAMLFACVGCGDKTEEIVYTDREERPTITQPTVSDFVKYPSMPTSAPVVDSETPSVSGYEVSENSYTMTETDAGMKFAYEDLADWSYVYVKIDDYNATLSNIKMVLDVNGAERIAVQAIYYEMAEKDYKPVTVYLGDLSDGEQFVIFELGQLKALDASYSYVAEESLKDQQILGFVLFVDTNPKQIAPSDYKGEFTVKEVKFLADGDKELADKYVAPSVNSITADADITVDTSGENPVCTYEAGKLQYSAIFLNLANYSSSYTEFVLNLKTTGVKKLAITIQFSGGQADWQTESTALYEKEITADGEQTINVDFSDAQPLGMDWNYVSGFYIKNYKVLAIKIMADSDQANVDHGGSIEIGNIEFIKTVEDTGVSISKAWSTNSSQDMAIQDGVAVGGYGSVDVSYHTAWWNLVMPVKSYSEPKTKLVVKVVVPETGWYHLGIACKANGQEVVLRASAGLLDGANTEIPSKEGLAAGVVETVTYDESNRMYTFTFDFTNAQKNSATNKAFYEETISALMFYLNDPVDQGVGSHEYEGAKTLTFAGVYFE